MKRSILSVAMLSLIVAGCSDAGSKKSGNEGGSDAAKGDIKADVFKTCYAAPSEYSSEYGDTGLMRTLPPLPDDKVENKEDFKIKERNILTVRVNRANQILVTFGCKKHEMMNWEDLKELKDKAKAFILNAWNDEDLPEKTDFHFVLPNGSTWVYPVSSGVVFLMCDADVNYECYMEVQNELTRAFNEIRDEVAINRFGTEFKGLSVADKAAITKAVPMNISEAESREDVSESPQPTADKTVKTEDVPKKTHVAGTGKSKPSPKKVEIKVHSDVFKIVTNEEKVEAEINFEDFRDDVEFITQVDVVEETVEDDQPYVVAEQMPSFNGGDIRTFHAWVQRQVRYPMIAQEKGITGRVLLSFVVEKDGSLGQIRVLQTPDQSLADEAIRVMKSAPKWVPGKQRNQTVRVSFTLPVEFRLQN